jgi:hypothetical protein
MEKCAETKRRGFSDRLSVLVSAAKTDDGGFAIEASELFRVYPPAKGSVARNVPPQRSVGHGATAAGQDATGTETAIRLAELETELRVVRELLDEVKASRDDMRAEPDGLRAERDDWRARAERLLTDQRPKPRQNSTGEPRKPAEPREPQSAEPSNQAWPRFDDTLRTFTRRPGIEPAINGVRKAQARASDRPENHFLSENNLSCLLRGILNLLDTRVVIVGVADVLPPPRTAGHATSAILSPARPGH